MKNNKGFTLTEILLAVMIVGLIAISLAALTRAAAREYAIICRVLCVLCAPIS